MGLGSKQKVVHCAIPDRKQSEFIIATPKVVVSFDEKVKHNEIILATPQVVVGFDAKVSQEHTCRWNNPALFRRRSPEVVNIVNINDINNDTHDLPIDIGKKKTGSWMELEGEIAPPHWDHSIYSHNSIINKRYADANELHIKFRFTTESQNNFKKHKLTPSGKKF